MKESNPVKLMLEFWHRMNEAEESTLNDKIDAARQQTFDDEMTVVDDSDKNDEVEKDYSKPRDLKNYDTIQFDTTRKSLFLNSMKNREFLGGNLNIHNEYKEYTLEKVKQLCSTLIGKNFVIYDDFFKDFENAVKEDRNVRNHKFEYCTWHDFYKSKYLRNVNGRYGYVFEMALANKPDTESKADLENASNSSESVEAKSKSSKTSHISVTSSRLESIMKELNDVENDVKSMCDNTVKNVTNLLNTYIYNDIQNIKGGDDYKIITAIQPEPSKQVNIIEIADSKKHDLLKLDIKIATKQDVLFSDEKVLHYTIKCLVPITEDIFKNTRSNLVTSVIPITFFIDNGITEFTSELKIEIPIFAIIYKIIEKCPNIVIAFGENYDIKDEYYGLGSIYEFNTFKFYKKKEGLENEELVRMLFELLSKKIFNVKFTVSGNAKTKFNSGTKNTTKQHSLSMKISPSFNAKLFINYMTNNENSLYVEC